MAAILNQLVRGWRDSGKGGILAYSGLKEKYRQALLHGIPADQIVNVLLNGSHELLSDRLAARHQYINQKLLDSQFATLEPAPDAIRVMNDRAPQLVVEDILSKIAAWRKIHL